MRPLLAAACLALALPLAAQAEEVGRVGVDMVGNDIVVDAFADPLVPAVTCHVAYFKRSLYDRLSRGNWFEDPSYSAVDCTANGPVTVGANVPDDKGGQNVFTERQSLVWKRLKVTRIVDRKNHALIYLAHTTQVTQGSGKMSMSVIPIAN